MGRAVARAGKAGARALKKAAPPARPAARRPARAPAPAPAGRTAAVRPPVKARGTWSEGVTVGAAGARRYRLYRPAGLAGQAVPLLVMLHGCRQSAAELAAVSRMDRLADQQDWMLLLPEQDRLAHPQGCWNWYGVRTGRAQAEAQTLLAMIEQVAAQPGCDPDRVALAGLSAGAGMAALMAERAPGRFRAVAMHSGVAPGAAQSQATALAAMQGRRQPVLQAGHVAPGAAGRLPPLLVLQGRRDGVVAASNGRAAAQAWAHAMGALPGLPRTVQRGKRHAMHVTDYRLAGRAAVTLCEIDTLGHAWSGGAADRPYSDPAGPDASRLIVAFARRQFARARPVTD